MGGVVVRMVAFMRCSVHSCKGSQHSWPTFSEQYSLMLPLNYHANWQRQCTVAEPINLSLGLGINRNFNCPTSVMVASSTNSSIGESVDAVGSHATNAPAKA